MIDKLYFAEILSLYDINTKSVENENDCQPVILDDELMELNHAESEYPKVIPMISSQEKLKCRKVEPVLRYHQPSAHKSLEQYAHHFLFAFYPFRNEEHLKSAPLSGTYYHKLQEPGLMEMVEPYGEMVDQALSNLWSDLTNADVFSQQENDEVEEELALVVNDLLDEQDNTNEVVLLEEKSPIPAYITPILIPDNKLNLMIRSLNHKQCELCNIVQSWAKQYIKNRSVSNQFNLEPLRLFLTSNAGCGKTFFDKGNVSGFD